ncbi:MAG TPA: polyhydroxyalkanoic acid system family protein [Thermoanaerobaculia bacterium]|nr:polyhydroxyalkanoic acid system family protein [Thermoanaerobaculia bacterium]
MSDLMIEVVTVKQSMAELRPGLDAALQKEFPGGMLQRRWNGDVLELSGPGAKGTIVFEAGRLVGRATLGPPASLMRGMIEQKVGAALRAVVG